MKIPSLSKLVSILPAILDARAEARMNIAAGKRFTISHPNPYYNEALEKASWDLNAAGVSTYHEAIVMFDQKVNIGIFYFV